MMAKDRDQRPQSALEVRESLEAILATLPDPLVEEAKEFGADSGPVRRIAAVSTPAAMAAPTAATARPSGIQPAAGGRRWPWFAGIAVVLIAIGVAIPLLSKKSGDPGQSFPPVAAGEPIPVGVLHSQSGTMATSEASVVDATLLAIDEVNAAGGALGRKLNPVVMDGKSNPEEFEKAAERLIRENKVAVIFGCWTSAARKAVRPVVERSNALLFYPVQYEGLEQSPRIVYLGPSANQQLTPAIDFLVHRQGKKRLFLVGSDYVFPRAVHEIVKDRVKLKAGVEIAGEAFVPLGSRDVVEMIAAIKAARPDAILNSINGTTNFAFLRDLNADPATAGIPVLSLSLMENDIRRLDPKGVAGDYLAATYFESVGSESGRAFVAKFRERYGPERRYADPVAAAYCGVHLWAKAADAGSSLDPAAVTKAIAGQSFLAPCGEIRIDGATQHAILPMRIGQIQPDGTVAVVETSPQPIAPDPFPATRTRADWDRFLNDLYLGWDSRWQAPAR
jgi:urea transport system substrate-binding protein